MGNCASTGKHRFSASPDDIAVEVSSTQAAKEPPLCMIHGLMGCTMRKTGALAFIPVGLVRWRQLGRAPRAEAAITVHRESVHVRRDVGGRKHLSSPRCHREVARMARAVTGDGLAVQWIEFPVG